MTLEQDLNLGVEDLKKEADIKAMEYLMDVASRVDCMERAIKMTPRSASPYFSTFLSNYRDCLVEELQDKRK